MTLWESDSIQQIAAQKQLPWNLVLRDLTDFSEGCSKQLANWLLRKRDVMHGNVSCVI